MQPASVVTRRLNAAFASAVSRHAIEGLGLRMSIVSLDVESGGWGDDIRTVRLKTRLARDYGSPGVRFALFAHVRERMRTIDFCMELRWRPASDTKPRLMCRASLELAAAHRDPDRQKMVQHPGGLSRSTFEQLRAALFPPCSTPPSVPRLSDAALVAVVLAAAGATIDLPETARPRSAREPHICLGCAWDPAHDYKFQAALGIDPDSPGFPRRTNWIERAARKAMEVPEPYDEHYKSHGFNCAVEGEDSTDTDTDSDEDEDDW